MPMTARRAAALAASSQPFTVKTGARAPPPDSALCRNGMCYLYSLCFHEGPGTTRDSLLAGNITPPLPPVRLSALAPLHTTLVVDNLRALHTSPTPIHTTPQRRPHVWQRLLLQGPRHQQPGNYYSNPNGSTYYNDGAGGLTYTAPSGGSNSQSTGSGSGSSGSGSAQN